MARKDLTEALGTIQEAANDGTIPIQAITPGWGSSGHYSAAVLEAAAKAKVWPKGSHLYWNHPSASEGAERPERDVKDIGAVLVEDARWDGKALVARAKPVGFSKEVLADPEFRKAIGVSVRANAEMSIGEAEGRTGWIVEEILPGTFNSIDFVTHAGRGGRILEVLESARAAQVEEAGELDSDRRDKFRNAVRDAHASDGVDVWVEDYDDTTVYWDRWGGDDPGTFSQTYTETDDAVELTGDPVQVRVKRTYVPIDEAEAPFRAVELTREAALTAIRESRNIGQWMESRIHLAFTCTADEMFGDGRLTREERITLSNGIGAALDAFTAVVQDKAPQLYSRDLWAEPEALVAVAEAATTNVPVHPAGQTTNPRENTMPDIEEARLRELEEAHGRVPTLTTERDTAISRAEEAETSLAAEKAKSHAREYGATRVREANSELDPAAVDRIVSEAMREIPLTEAEKAADRRLDVEAFGKRIDEARTAEETYLATVIKNRGGSVQGLGQTDSKTDVTEAQVTNIVAGAFGRTVKGA